MRQNDLDGHGCVERARAGSLLGRSVASTDPDAFLALLHRHPAAVAHVALQTATGFADLGPRVGGLPRGTPVATLDIDDLFDPNHHTYVTVHGFGSSAARRNEHVACLNAVALDLDIAHDSTRDLAEAEAALDDAIAGGVVPEPNIVVRSGRGFWLLWLLGTADDDPTPPAVTPETTSRYKALHRAVCDRLQAFSPDRAAGDLARLMRLPGSYNAKTGDPSFRGSFVLRHERIFTLEGLATALSVIDSPLPVPPLAQPEPPARLREHTPRRLLKHLGRSSGGLARIQRPFDLAIRLAAERGNVPEGHRHDWLFVVAHFLVRLCRDDEQEQEEMLVALNETHCHPPAERSQLRAMLRGLRRHRDHVGPGGMLSNKQVVARLRMTVEEQRRHRFHVPRVRVPQARAQALAERRGRYEDVIRNGHGILPSARAMARATGLHVRQVQRDYHRLRYA